MRILAMATSLKARAMLTLAYGCGLRAGEVVRLRAGNIDSEQMIIRIVQSKGRKDRHVMLPAEVLELLRQWWKARPTEQDAGDLGDSGVAWTRQARDDGSLHPRGDRNNRQDREPARTPERAAPQARKARH